MIHRTIKLLDCRTQDTGEQFLRTEYSTSMKKKSAYVIIQLMQLMQVKERKKIEN